MHINCLIQNQSGISACAPYALQNTCCRSHVSLMTMKTCSGNGQRLPLRFIGSNRSNPVYSGVDYMKSNNCWHVQVEASLHNLCIWVCICITCFPCIPQQNRCIDCCRALPCNLSSASTVLSCLSYGVASAICSCNLFKFKNLLPKLVACGPRATVRSEDRCALRRQHHAACHVLKIACCS